MAPSPSRRGGSAPVRGSSRQGHPTRLPSARWVCSLRTRLIDWWISTERDEDFPWRRSGLPPYRSLITEILLQRTRAKAVAGVYESFFMRFPDAESLGSASVRSIRSSIRSLGLHWRAEKLRELGAALRTGVPTTPKALLALPGVGPYAAGAFLSLHMGRRSAAPDSNVVRIYGRVFGVTVGPESRRSGWFLRLSEHLVPRRKFREFNYALLDLGRDICTPARPHCPDCPIKTLCRYGGCRS